MEMAVEACVKPNMTMDEEDEDAPVVFKRRDTSSKHTNQPNSESRAFVRPDKQPGKLTPDRNQSSSGLKSPIRSDKQPGKPVQDGRTVVSKGKVVQSSKPSSSNAAVAIKKSPPPSAKASPSSSSRASPVKSPSLNGGSSVGQPPRKDNRLSAVKEEKRSVSDSEDSEDDKPISVRLSAGLQKSNSKVDERDDKLSASDSEGSDDDKPLSARLSSAVSKGNSTSKERASSFGSLHSIKPKVDDSDDEKPLSSKFSRNSSTGASCSKSYEAKPLASKVQLNGSIKRENIIKTSSMSNKRPSSENSSGQSSLKKAKVVDTPPAAKAKQVSMKAETKDEDDHIPIAQRMKKATPDSKSVTIKKKDKKVDSSSLKKVNQKSKKMMKKSMYSKSYKVPPGSGEGQKWTTLVHNGVIFPPPYKPHGVKMLYDGKPIVLTPEQEEVATMYAVMLETDYIQKPKFNENFFSDWKKLLGKNHVIQDLKKCDFTPIYQWHLAEKEKKKQMSSEVLLLCKIYLANMVVGIDLSEILSLEKKALREEKLKQEEKYMWAIVDGVKEKVGNFRVEPPGLFRGRGEHPKMGKLKKRIYPSDITINIGKDATVPECPIPGQRWKEVRHDNTVTWLAYWNDPINPKEFKYVFLAASSSLKGQSDKEKYEKSRKLKDYIQGIRKAYTRDFTSKDMAKQQIAVATYLIDRLALRAGNEKDDDEADTVGCCTLKVENVKPIPPNILEFDFLGKDSIKYYKQFEPEPLVFKAIERFRKGKQPSDDLFDRLDTSKLNAHLKELMPGLTAKVFRTFNASFTLDDMLSQGAGGGEVPQKLDVYREANKEVAIICNHQRTVSKSHTAQMERLTQKINAAKELLSELEIDLARAKKGKPPLKDSSGKQKRNLTPEALEKKIVKTKGDIQKLERDMQTKEDLKEIALGTSKINYLDPRITVAWCKRNEVPIEKIFNKSLLAKFAWAMDAPPHFKF